MTESMTCFACNGEMHLVRENAEMSIGARKAAIDVERLRCSDCGETFYTPEQMDAAQHELAAVLRAKESLLPPERVRGIRERFKLTQSQLEQLLGVGPKTVVRWERGTVFQNKATDQLLRVLEGVPGVFAFMVKQSKLELREKVTCPAPAIERSATRTFRLPTPQKRGLVPRRSTDRHGNRVVQIADFRQESKIRLRVGAETAIPDFSLEVMR